MKIFFFCRKSTEMKKKQMDRWCNDVDRSKDRHHHYKMFYIYKLVRIMMMMMTYLIWLEISIFFKKNEKFFPLDFFLLARNKNFTEILPLLFFFLVIFNFLIFHSFFLFLFFFLPQFFNTNEKNNIAYMNSCMNPIL